jgi:hypothetical protein
MDQAETRTAPRQLMPERTTQEMLSVEFRLAQNCSCRLSYSVQCSQIFSQLRGSIGVRLVRSADRAVANSTPMVA